MFTDRKHPNDQAVSQADGGVFHKAKDNVTKITDAMEQESPEVDYAHLDWAADAKYDKKKKTIFIAEEYRDLHEEEPELFEPLLAHERVHAEFQSEEPQSEVSLQAYVDEEIAAYRAEYEAWQDIKDHYTSPEISASLSPAGRELVYRYEAKMEKIERVGWDGYRAELERTYRDRMLKSR